MKKRNLDADVEEEQHMKTNAGFGWYTYKPINDSDFQQTTMKQIFPHPSEATNSSHTLASNF